MIRSQYKGLDLWFDYKEGMCIEPAMSHKEIHEFVMFCIDVLGLDKKKLSRILFQFRNSVNPSVKGSMVFNEENSVGVISINEMSCAHFLKELISHEMVHVDQWARGDLRRGLMQCARRGMIELHQWLGINYDHEETPYDQLPWEREAHDRQGIIATEYILQGLIAA